MSDVPQPDQPEPEPADTPDDMPDDDDEDTSDAGGRRLHNHAP